MSQQQESNRFLRYIGKADLSNTAGIVIEGDDAPYLFRRRRTPKEPLPMQGEQITLLLNDEGLIDSWEPFDMDAHIDRIEAELSKPLAHPETRPSPESRMSLLELAIHAVGPPWGAGVAAQVMATAEEFERWCYRP